MKLLVVDGNSIANRAFYGIKALTTKDGRFTNAVYGFMTTFFSLAGEYTPDHFAVAFDVHEPTFRHKMYTEYKAGRHAMPEELREQMPVIKNLLKYLGYTVVECPGWEADDILGTLSTLCAGGDMCYIATGDRDSLQLINKNTSVCLATAKGTVLYDEKRLFDEYALTPPQMIELKALQGDSSDNIPGVPGVGPKTATSLISKYGSIDYIYDNFDSIEVKGAMREKLAANKDKAYLSRELGTIKKDAPVSLNAEDYLRREADNAAALSLLTDLELYKIIEKAGLDKDDVATLTSVEGAAKISEGSISDINADEIFIFPEYSGKEIDYLALCDGDLNVLRAENDGFAFTSQLSAVLENPGIKKTVFDVKTLYEWAYRHSTHIKGEVFDIMLAGYVLNPNGKDYSPSRLCAEYKVRVPQVNSDDQALRQAALMPRLKAALVSYAEENNQLDLINNIEIPFAEVLASMEVEGFAVDKEKIEDYSSVLGEKISSLEKSIYLEAGEQFNINSPKQLAEILFVKLGLPSGKKTKSGYSTSADVLENLAASYTIVESVLNYRLLAKLKSTYCEGLLDKIAPDGKIRSTFNQTETRTGRISSAEPNLQNIPVRTPEGREFRKFFKAGEGRVLVDADYSQIELRVLAHLADDANMIEAFNSGMDIHAVTASQVFNMPLNMVTPLMRSKAKAVNFGIVYGIGAFSLAKDIKVSRKQAQDYIDGYLNHYKGIDNYMKQTVALAKQNGFVSTLFGRRRNIPELMSSNFNTRAFGERVARNMPVQGTAADIIKIAMVRVFRRLREEAPDAKIIMQVHDEIIVDSSEKDAEKVKSILKAEMEGAVKMKVGLVADAHIGKTWYEAKGD